MPRTPKYCHHKATDQGYATINGAVVYFGKYDDPESRDAYDRAIAHWREVNATLDRETTIGQLAVMFVRQHATDYYSKSEMTNYQYALKVLVRMFRTTKVCDFGPKKLIAVRDELAKKHVRIQVNNHLARLKRMFEWGVQQELVSGNTFYALKCVKNLKRGRSKAREGKPVLPVPQADIDAVLPHLTSPVAAMVKLQLLTGMRPGEVLKMRAGDIDTSGEVWIYRPELHKNAWRGKQRTVMIGPRGQDVLLPFLIGRQPNEYLFNPHDGRQQFVEANWREDAKSYVRGSNDGENKPYTLHGYISSIQRVCKRLKIEKWSPGRLRHNAATNVNRDAGDIDAARCLLGHSEKTTTEIYAERDLTKAAEIARRFG